MPLTGVWKAFKPDGKDREIEDALRDPDVPTESLELPTDLRFGTRVQLALAGNVDPELAHRVLGQFPFRFWRSAAALSPSFE
jgi:hypothetical protein